MLWKKEGTPMEYTVQALARLAGVSPRTLRWYDQIGLLTPGRRGENGYRLYGPREVDRLQQILFYRALGVELEVIKAILDDPAFHETQALQSHLKALRGQQKRLAALIRTVEATLAAKERRLPMKDERKFEGFKAQLVEENEKTYGKEARARYGDAPVDAANAKLLNMGEEEHARWTALEEEMLTRLAAAAAAGEDPAGTEGAAIAALHGQWLSFVGDYTPRMRAGLARLYTADERFSAYYDKHCPGAAAFLTAAILAQTEKEEEK